MIRINSKKYRQNEHWHIWITKPNNPSAGLLGFDHYVRNTKEVDKYLEIPSGSEVPQAKLNDYIDGKINLEELIKYVKSNCELDDSKTKKSTKKTRKNKSKS